LGGKCIRLEERFFKKENSKERGKLKKIIEKKRCYWLLVLITSVIEFGHA